MAKSNPTESALLASKICNQISSVFSTKSPNPAALDVLVQEIADVANRNGRVFVYGVGREGLMLKALSMRLFHLGLSAHCVFDMNTPPIGPSDLLISSAGPGGFSTVDAISGVAKSNGARVLLLTAQPDSGSSMKYASVVAYIPAQTMADDKAGDGEKERPLLPMGSVYEGAMFLLFEMVVFKLGEILKQSPEDVRARHTNLDGIAPPAHYVIQGKEYDMGYYLANGIYPKWSTIVQTIRDPHSQKKKYFMMKQESCRKDVERAFGVLQLLQDRHVF